MFYSAKTGWFYVLGDENIPDDAVEITAEYHQLLIEGESSGKIITSDENGRPVLADPPPLSAEELAAQATTRRDQLLGEAALRIAPLQDAVDIDEATAAEVALLKQWKQYRVALNRIQDQTGYPSEITWPTAPAA